MVWSTPADREESTQWALLFGRLKLACPVIGRVGMPGAANSRPSVREVLGLIASGVSRNLEMPSP